MTIKRAITRPALAWLGRHGWEFRKIRQNDSDLSMYYALYGREDVEQRRFYNVGAGPFDHPAWTNIDHVSDHYHWPKIDIDFDLMQNKPLPIDYETANIVYSSHVIDRLPNESAQVLFNEAARILKPNGVLRITVGDIDLAWRALITNDRDFFYWIGYYDRPQNVAKAHFAKRMSDVSLKQVFLNEFATQISELWGFTQPLYTMTDQEFDDVFSKLPYEQALDYCVSKCSLQIHSPGSQINWWNTDKLLRMFKLAGFTKIWRSGEGQSIAPVLRNTRHFDNTHPKASLFVEAVK